ncbi:ATP-binding protein [Gorillibacterium sp. sgz5001074]|uniref:ATP-binding protein n=1 Tax=Gorillibacterium sp. sgz5001074 TaxID=3446695 RepID=UPI003F67E150
MLLKEYFVQLGIIMFPITVYQIWMFGKSYNQLPQRTWMLGLYGGLSAILCQTMPVHILGKPENFQCVPIILSILYGKRRAGLLSITILIVYKAAVDPFNAVMAWDISAVLIYSAIPLAYCLRFDKLAQRKRLLVSQLLSVVTLLVQLMLLLAYFTARFGGSGLQRLSEYIPFLAIACVIQLVIMGLLFFLLENIIEHGRMMERQSSIIDYNPLGIVLFDEHKRFVSVNPAYERIIGYKKEELVGRSRLELWFEPDHELAEAILHEAAPGGIMQNIEVSLRHKNGHRVPVRFTMLPIMAGEALAGYFAMVMDMTEMKEAEEMVRNSEKLTMIGQLAAGIAHEIRNPLTAVKGFLQLLSQPGGPSHSRYYGIIQEEISRIEGIISEMLILAKPHVVSYRPVDVKEKLEEVASLLEGEGNMQNVEIRKDFTDRRPLVLADGNQLKQVFVNLGKNAIEAMPEGGLLTIRMSQEGAMLLIRFEDNGGGIPAEILSRIGEPFFTTKEKGTGLGLLTSRRILADHKGSLDIASSPGEGTSVGLVLPVLEEAGSACLEAASASE